MTFDLINGLFEFVAAALTFGTSVRALMRDKKIAGFSPVPLAFFTAWGLWNIFYYPSLDQWFSFAGGIAVVSVNLFYLFLIHRYTHNLHIPKWIRECRFDGECCCTNSCAFNRED